MVESNSSYSFLSFFAKAALVTVAAAATYICTKAYAQFQQFQKSLREDLIPQDSEDLKDTTHAEADLLVRCHNCAKTITPQHIAQRAFTAGDNAINSATTSNKSRPTSKL